MLPRSGLDYGVRVARLAPKFKNDAGVEVALQLLYEDFIDNAISFGCNNAKRRKVCGEDSHLALALDTLCSYTLLYIGTIQGRARVLQWLSISGYPLPPLLLLLPFTCSGSADEATLSPALPPPPPLPPSLYRPRR